MKVPPEIMQQIIFFCESNGYGFAELSCEDVSLLIIGSNRYSPDQASIVGAHLLLAGVVSGGWNEINDNLRQRQEEEKKH